MQKLSAILLALLVSMDSAHAQQPPVPAPLWLTQANADTRPLKSFVSAGKVNFNSPSLACCKVCSVGKACGNTCISRAKTCHVGQGCACDG